MKRIYTPIIDCRSSGCRAIQTLSETSKPKITPLLQLWGPEFDFVKNRYRKTTGEHALAEARRINAALKGLSAFYIQLMPELFTSHDATTFYAMVRSECPQGIPVLAPATPGHLIEAIRSAGRLEGRVALRIGLSLQELYWAERFTKYDAVDLVVDAGYVRMRDVKLLLPAVQEFSRAIAHRGFSSVTLVGGSMPSSFSAIGEFGMKNVPRREWGLWKTVSQRMKFGDYTTEHPRPSGGDMRGVTPCPKIPYTTNGGWNIFKGKAVKPIDYGQYRTLCRAVTGDNSFSGAGFSWADGRMHNHAIGNLSDFKELALWKAIRMNHHMERVLWDIEFDSET